MTGQLEIPTHSTPRIFAWDKPRLVKDIATLQRKAEKLGQPPVIVEFSAPYVECVTYYYTDDEGNQCSRPTNVEVIDLYISGGVPKINGWEFVATITGFDQEFKQVSTSPLFKGNLPKRFRTTDCTCDHCNNQRRRSEVYVLRNVGSGNFKQVGRQCLKDFLGSPDVLAVIKYIDKLHLFQQNEDRASFNGDIGTVAYEEADRWLANTFACIEVHGWVPANLERLSEGRQVSTKGRVFERLYTRNPKCPPTFKAEDRHYEQARECQKWLRQKYYDLDGELRHGLQDFDYNLAACIQKGYIHPKAIGIATYAPQAYLKYLGKVEDRKKEVRLDEYFGKVGEMVDLRVKVTKVIGLESRFGASYLHIAKDPDGRAFIWKRDHRQVENYGDEIEIRAKVKKHETRYNKFADRDEKQTVLTLVKVK